jgi:hypothetical protein
MRRDTSQAIFTAISRQVSPVPLPDVLLVIAGEQWRMNQE